MIKNVVKSHYEACIELQPVDGLYVWKVFRVVGDDAKSILIDIGACSSIKKCILDAQQCKEEHELNTADYYTGDN